MTAPLILAVFAVAASSVGSRVLSRAKWTHRAPRWGIWAWQALTTAVTFAILLIGVTLALPALPVRADVAALFQTTPLRVAEHYTTPAGFTLAVVSACAAVAILARIVSLVAVHLRRAARVGRSQRDVLTLVATEHPGGFFVVQHKSPSVYCLPGRRRVVVVTSAALAMLEPHEMQLVLAHERMHLRARHDLAVAVASGLDLAFRGWGVFGHAHRHIETLIEMHADDSARGVGDRRALARALITLCSSAAPPTALAAGGADALLRVRRLAGAPTEALAPRQSLLLGVITMVLLLSPMMLALAPALEATISNCWSATHGA